MPEGNQPWIFTGKFDAEAEAPLLWPLDIESWVIGKDPDYRKDWEMKEKGQHRMRWFYGRGKYSHYFGITIKGA